MSTKRKHSESEAIHPSRQAQVPGALPQPSKKPRRTAPPTHKKPESHTSVNAIKKRLRDVKRRLERSRNLPATIRVEDERALAAYQQELAAANEEKERQKMIKKYHMVRFFERQKATRHVKKLRKRILEAKSTDEVEKLKDEMYAAEVDLNYTQYYPLNQRYVSLYPQKSTTTDKDEEEDEGTNTVGKRPPMWAEVEKSMSHGTLEQLRNGGKTKLAATNGQNSQYKHKASKPVLPKSFSTPHTNESAVKASSPLKDNNKFTDSKKKPKAQTTSQHDIKKDVGKDDDGDDGSDGGFFEE